MSLFQVLNQKVDTYLKEKRMEDTPENRIEALNAIKDAIALDEMPYMDGFKIMQAVDSEISVQRCRTHIKNLTLF